MRTIIIISVLLLTSCNNAQTEIISKQLSPEEAYCQSALSGYAGWGSLYDDAMEVCLQKMKKDMK